MSKYSYLTVIFSYLTVIFSYLTVIFSYLTPVKALHSKAFRPLKKKKEKRKKEKRFFHEKQLPMPSLKLGRFNLAKARLRGCFFQMIIENQKQKKQKRLWTRFARVFSKAKALDSKNYRAASIFKSGFSRGNKRTFIVSLVDTR